MYFIKKTGCVTRVMPIGRVSYNVGVGIRGTEAGRTQHASRPRSTESSPVSTSSKAAMAEARRNFEADPFPSSVRGISLRIRSLHNKSQRADSKHGVRVGSAAASGGAPPSHGRDGRGGRGLGPIHALHVRLALQRHAAGVACRYLCRHYSAQRVATRLGALLGEKERSRVRTARRAAEARGRKVRRDLEPLAAAAMDEDAAARQALKGAWGHGDR